jgi:hypothetical protein
MTMAPEISKDDVQKPITEASPEIKRIIARVLQAEKDKLYMKTARYITDDIRKIFEEEIK